MFETQIDPQKIENIHHKIHFTVGVAFEKKQPKIFPNDKFTLQDQLQMTLAFLNSIIIDQELLD